MILTAPGLLIYSENTGGALLFYWLELGMLKILILGHQYDGTALRIYARLRKKYNEENIQFVVAEALAMAPYWVHQLSDTPLKSSPQTTIQLAGDKPLQIDENTTIFNRITYAPMPHFASSNQLDLHYAEMEMNALWLSWLYSLGDQVINQPSPRNLSGAGFSRIEWSSKAIVNDIPVVRFRQDSQSAPQNQDQLQISLLAIGEFIERDPSNISLSSEDLSAITSSIKRIQQFSRCQYLRTYFTFQDSTWRFDFGDALADPFTDQQVKSITRYLETKAGLS